MPCFKHHRQSHPATTSLTPSNSNHPPARLMTWTARFVLKHGCERCGGGGLGWVGLGVLSALTEFVHVHRLRPSVRPHSRTQQTLTGKAQLLEGTVHALVVERDLLHSRWQTATRRALLDAVGT